MRYLLNKHIVLIRYFFIGISAAVLDLGVYAILFNYFDWTALMSTTVSIMIATVYAFSLNMVFNFKTKGNVILRLISYSSVSAVGLLISISMLYFFTDIQGYDGNLIKILSLPLIFIVQYILNKNITFRKVGNKKSGLI